MLFSADKPHAPTGGPLPSYQSLTTQAVDVSKMVVEESAQKSRARVGEIIGNLCSDSDTRTAQFHQGAGAKTYDFSSKTVASAAQEALPTVGDGIKTTDSDLVQVGGGSFAQHAQSVASPHVTMKTFEK